jgi:hypothetical protein
MGQGQPVYIKGEHTMSNSQRIEQATRKHVGATLTNDQIVELVKVTSPEWRGGVYPSDSAYKRTEDGKLIPRGKVAYGDGVLEYLGENSFKVLPTEQIVRRPGGKKVAPAEAKPVATTGKKKAAKSKTSLKPPVVAKQKARDTHVSQ